MDASDILSKLELTRSISGFTYGLAWGLLGTLAVTAACFSFFRALLLGEGGDPVAYFVRLVFVVGCLSGYRTIVDTLLDASSALTSLFADGAGWDVYWSQVAGQFRPLFEEGEGSAWDRLLGWMQGGLLTAVVSVTYYLEFLVFQFVSNLSVCFLALLDILGPLMIVGGVLGNGQSLRQWFHALVQVLLWPAVPPFLMLIIVRGSGNAIESGNLAFIVGQNTILCFLGVLTPLIVAFILGSGGVAAFAGAVSGAAGSALTGSAARLVAIARRGEGSAGAGRQPYGTNHDNGLITFMPRPGDAPVAPATPLGRATASIRTRRSTVSHRPTGSQA